MIVLGIVGGIGAGKTTVVSLLQEVKPTYVIGADEIGHGLLLKHGKAYDEVVKTFGTHILDDEGNIVRAKLGKIVFSDKEALERLNAITHPLILEEVKKEIEWCSKQDRWKWIIIDAALLIEIGLVKLTDKVIAVFASEETRAKRVCIREGYTKEEAINRIRAQKEWKEFEEVATHVIDNSASVKQTKDQIFEMTKYW